MYDFWLSGGSALPAICAQVNLLMRCDKLIWSQSPPTHPSPVEASNVLFMYLLLLKFLFSLVSFQVFTTQTKSNNTVDLFSGKTFYTANINDQVTKLRPKLEPKLSYIGRGKDEKVDPLLVFFHIFLYLRAFFAPQRWYLSLIRS